MKVILRERVPSLGNVGEIVNVSAGHARNYLIPNRLAVLADDSNQKALENEQRRLAKKIAEEKSVATALKKKIDGVTIELTKRVGGNGKLFGSVTNSDLAKELGAKGIEIERRLLVIENPIKALGDFEVKAKIFQDVEALFNVKVVMDPKQLEEIKAKEAEMKARKEAAAKKAKEEAEKKEEEVAEESTEA